MNRKIEEPNLNVLECGKWRWATQKILLLFDG